MDYGHSSELTAATGGPYVGSLINAPGSASSPQQRPAGRLHSVRIEGRDSLVISKPEAGLSAAWVDQTRQVLRAAANGDFGAIKFIVFQVVGGATAPTARASEANLLLGEIANLVLNAPIITIAQARNTISGGDLELALACSMLICDEDTKFSFAADPVEAVATYALLAQKLGFVRAERLMEQDAVLSAAQMRDLLLLKEVTPSNSKLEDVTAFLTRVGRRHNSAAAMYRAQRISTPLIAEFFGGAPH